MIDLIKMRFLTYEEEGKKQIESPIPDEMEDEAQFARANLLETLYNYSDEMEELAFEEKPISNELIRETIRKATLAGKIQPVVCGSALHGIGVQGVLDGVK
jgi:elongation factor G